MPVTSKLSAATTGRFNQLNHGHGETDELLGRRFLCFCTTTYISAGLLELIQQQMPSVLLTDSISFELGGIYAFSLLEGYDS